MSKQLLDTTIAGSAGFSLSALSKGYITLFVIGLCIGAIAWYYKKAHSEPKWNKQESFSEALKYFVFGGLAMPATVDASVPLLEKYHIHATVSVQILMGGVVSFLAVELLWYIGVLISKKGGE